MLPGLGAGAAACQPGEQQPPALVQSRIHPDEGWERWCCSCSLLLLFWLFPTTTPCRSQHPSVTAALGTGEQEKEFGLVSSVLVLCCGPDRCLAYANSSCSTGGKKKILPRGWWRGEISRHEGAGTRSMAAAW